ARLFLEDDKADPGALLGQVIGAADPGDARPDDHDIEMLGRGRSHGGRQRSCPGHRSGPFAAARQLTLFSSAAILMPSRIWHVRSAMLSETGAILARSMGDGFRAAFPCRNSKSQNMVFEIPPSTSTFDGIVELPQRMPSLSRPCYAAGKRFRAGHGGSAS